MRVDIENDLLTIVTDVARHTRICADQMAQAHRLTRAQLVVMPRLERQSDVSQNDLAVLAEVAPITVARLIDRLEDLGLVNRCPDPEDRRIWRLRLTPAAAPILCEVKRLRAELHSIVTKEINPAALDVMTTGLRQMKENATSQRLAKASAK
jgi:MarR family transcriptional regulator for hemolysin